MFNTSWRVDGPMRSVLPWRRGWYRWVVYSPTQSTFSQTSTLDKRGKAPTREAAERDAEVYARSWCERLDLPYGEPSTYGSTNRKET